MLKIKPNSLRAAVVDAQPYGSESAVSYVSEVDGALTPFRTSSKGLQVQRQFRTGAAQLRSFLDESGERTVDQAAALDQFIRRIEGGRDGDSSVGLEQLWGPGKLAFDVVCASIHNDCIPLQTRYRQVVELTAGLNVCAEGTFSNLLMAAQDATLGSSAGGLKGHALKEWDNLLDQGILELVKNRHGTQAHYPGNEIHYVNAYRNFVAQDYGVDERPDARTRRLHIAPRQLWEARAALKRTVTPSNLIRKMADSCLQEVHDCFPDKRHRLLSETEVDDIYRRHGDDLRHRLVVHYGNIGVQTLLEEKYLDGVAEGSWRLIENATLLMREIAGNLCDAGVLAPFEATVAQRPVEPGSAVVKQIGENIFYVEDPKTQGERRPVVLDDLDVESTNLPMLAAALRNTPTEALGRFPVEQVLRCLPFRHDDAVPVALLSTPELLKYRHADRAREEHLLGHAANHMAAHGVGVRGRLLFQAIDQDDEPLAIHLVAAWEGFRFESLARRGRNPFHAPARRGFARFIGMFLPGVDEPCKNLRDAKGDSVAMVSVIHGRMDVLKAVLAAGVSPDIRNNDGQTALFLAAIHGRWDAITLLLAHGATADVLSGSSPTPLMLAAASGRIDAVDALIAHGASVDRKTTEGDHALMFAARHGHADVVEALIRHKSPLNDANRDGITALILSAGMGHVRVLALLLENKAKVDKASKDGLTPLIYAAGNGRLQAVGTLLAHGAKSNHRDSAGRTALMLAATGGHLDTVRALIQARVDVKVQDKRGRDARLLAILKGHHEVAEVLEQLRPIRRN